MAAPLPTPLTHSSLSRFMYRHVSMLAGLVIELPWGVDPNDLAVRTNVHQRAEFTRMQCLSLPAGYTC
eukprot:2353970-Pyramimonas_sp.AAC.1